MLDLTGEIRKTQLALKEKADKAYNNNKDEEAAVLYRKSAKLLRQLYHKEQDRNKKTKIIKQIKDYETFADKLETGQVTYEAKEDSKNIVTEGSDSDAFAETAKSYIMHSSVTWKDIGGLDKTKQEIFYALSLCLAQKPDDLSVEPWNNILLYGPPGTGKTLLAAAISNSLPNSNTQPRFLNVKVSSILSKYFGDSSKQISAIYDTARSIAPSVVFLDEFESLCSDRSSEAMSGAERRVLSTLLSELDGLTNKGNKFDADKHVFTVAATNRPWDLDAAILSRFDKKILVPLPDKDTRSKIIQLNTDTKRIIFDCPIEYVIELTEGLSGREMDKLFREAKSIMLMDCNPRLADVDSDLIKLSDYKIEARPVTKTELTIARLNITPATSDIALAQFTDWENTLE